MRLYSPADTALRSWLVTFEPINVPSVTHRIYATAKGLTKQAADVGRSVARRLGVSPMTLAVTVREG